MDGKNARREFKDAASDRLDTFIGDDEERAGRPGLMLQDVPAAIQKHEEGQRIAASTRQKRQKVQGDNTQLMTPIPSPAELSSGHQRTFSNVGPGAVLQRQESRSVDADEEARPVSQSSFNPSWSGSPVDRALLLGQDMVNGFDRTSMEADKVNENPGTALVKPALSATTIQAALAFLKSDEVIIYSDNVLDAASLQWQLRERVRESMKIIIIPSHHPEIFQSSLVFLDLRNKKCYHYDARPRDHEESASISIRQVKNQNEFYDIVKVERKALTFPGCQSQQYDGNCGILIVITAYYLLSQKDLPEAYDASLWCRILRTLIKAMDPGTNLDDLPEHVADTGLLNDEQYIHHPSLTLLPSPRC